MAIPAWKLQLQQNIAKKKVEKIKQDEQRRIQLLPPWKRAAIEQQTQSKNVIIIPSNSTSTAKSTSSGSNSPSKATVTSPRSTNSVNSVNSKPRTVQINKKSPTHNTGTGGTGSSGGISSGTRVPLKHAGKSQSIDVVDGGGKKVFLSSNSVDNEHDKDGELFGVSDEHCISVHNNPFLRREKKTGVAKTNIGNGSVSQGGLGNRQKVQDSTSSTTSKSTSPRVAWNGTSQPSIATVGKSSSSSPSHASTDTTKSSVSKNNFIIDKQKPATSPESKTKLTSPSRSKVTFIKSSTESTETESGRPSRSTERKLSVSEILNKFGRAASHEEKDRVRKQGSIELEEPTSPIGSSPRSKSSNARADYGRLRERSPSPVRNRFRAPPNSKPRPISSPVEVPTSVILSAGRSPTSSPQPVRRATFGTSANRDKAQAPRKPVNSSSNNIVKNASNHKQQAPKAPVPSISVSDKSPSQKQTASKAPAPMNKSPSKKSPVSVINNGSPGGVVLISRKHLLAYETHDAGRTPPPRRKNPLPASAIIDLSTAGPIQEASGKPPADPEQIAKEKAASASVPVPQNDTHKQSKKEPENNAENPKSNTVSSLLGAFGQNKTKAPTPPAPVKDESTAIPYPEDFRRPKSWQERQEENNTLPSQANLKQTKPVTSDSATNDTNLSISQSNVDTQKAEISPIPKSVEISPIPKSASETVSPIPKSETVSPIPNSGVVLTIPKTVTQNGHVSKPPEQSKAKGKGEASQEMMAKARAIKKVKKIVNYEVIGGNAPTGKPSMQMSKSGRNRSKSKLKLSFKDEVEEFEYQSEQSLMAEYGDYEEEEDEEDEEEEERHSSVSEDDDVGAPPSGFRENVPKATGGLHSYTPSYLRDLTPSMMREHQEATRRKEEAAKQPESEPHLLDNGDDFSSAGSASAAMLF